jgi:hypothetical protein
MFSKKFAATSGAAALIAGIAALPAGPAGTAAVAQPAAQCTNNPLLGTWLINRVKSKVTRNGGRIGNRIVIIAPYGKDGVTRVLIDEADPRLSGREEHYSLQFDGKFYPTKGGDPRLVQWTRVDCNNYDTVGKRQLLFNLPDGTVKQYVPDGQIQNHGHISVSADGKTLSDSHGGLLGDQSALQEETLVYDRM